MPLDGHNAAVRTSARVPVKEKGTFHTHSDLHDIQILTGRSPKKGT